jgi:hypothetical protein
MTPAVDQRLVGFLAVSAALHLLWLAIPLPTRVAPPKQAPLVAHLAPPELPQKSAVVGRQQERGIPTARTPDTAIVPAEADAPERATPTIDLDAAFATARSQARAAPPRTTLDAPRPELTVEAAVARATQRQAFVETRGAAGEYVTINGNSRCVTPLVVPHFLEGKTMLTQCEARKG